MGEEVVGLYRLNIGVTNLGRYCDIVLYSILNFSCFVCSRVIGVILESPSLSRWVIVGKLHPFIMGPSFFLLFLFTLICGCFMFNFHLT